MIINYWNRQIEKWIDVFSDDEPDLMGLQLVREFDNFSKKFYGIFDDDWNESHADSELFTGIRRDICREEQVVIVRRISYFEPAKPMERKVRRRVEQVSMPVKRSIDDTSQSRIKGVQDTSEDIIVTDKNVKIVSQLPINNRKQDIKVIARDDD
ncbi:MAG TPA: hypothetical protein VE544_09585, partial [Nitrososphaeraceae archaeon]|nr:hypothetical protein [Nitrososphaeraceae archaeon]